MLSQNFKDKSNLSLTVVTGWFYFKSKGKIAYIFRGGCLCTHPISQ